MQKESRFRQAVRAVWERSDQEHLGWPEVRREAAKPAVSALLARLGECDGEAELHLRYWESGDTPGVLLGRHLPGEWEAGERLTLEEACFWRRLLELTRGG